jgi:shikimate kinase
MGVGKSTLGRRLAAKLDYRFFDMDDLFESTYKISIDNFFTKYGEKLFRELEYKLLISTFEFHNAVISTGGGTACHIDAMKRMNEQGVTVFLQMPEMGIVQRLVNAKRKRPLVIGKSADELAEFVTDKLHEREPYYSESNLTVDALNIDLDKLTEKIKQKENEL